AGRALGADRRGSRTLGRRLGASRAAAFAGFLGQEGDGLVERQRIDLIAVRQRRVDAAVLHVGSVAARVQLDRLLVPRVLAEDAHRGSAAATAQRLARAV